jgi:hypothetical protein
MDLASAPSGRAYTALPIDATQGFPQAFSIVFNNTTYFVSLYVNIRAGLLDGLDRDLFELPFDGAMLVARFDVDKPDGSRATVFLRKLVPELEYLAGSIALYFPVQNVARKNLNGQGEFGSSVVGGIALR